MRDSRLGPSPSAVTRWSSLIVIALNAAFLVLYASGHDPFDSSRAIAKASDSIFPAKLASVGAGAAGLAVVLFFAMALWPRRRSSNIYPRLAAVLATSAFAVTGYVVAAAMQARLVATAFIAFIWVLAGLMLTMAARESPRRESLWLRVPFGVLLSVATLLLLQEIGIAIGTIRFALPYADILANWTVLAAAIAVLVGAMAALWLHDFTCAATTAGILAAILAMGTPDARAIMVASLGLVLLSVLAALAAARDPREPRHLRGRYPQQEASSELDADSTDVAPGNKTRKRKGKKPHTTHERSRRYLLEIDSLMRL